MIPKCCFDDGGIDYLLFYIEGQNVSPDFVAEKIAEYRGGHYQSRKEYLKMVEESRKEMEEAFNFEENDESEEELEVAKKKKVKESKKKEEKKSK